MGHHPYRRQMLCECSAVCGNVDAVGQAAHHQQTGDAPPEVGEQTLADPDAIVRGMPCADDCQHASGIQIDLSAKVEDAGGIGAARQTIRIGFIAGTDDADALLRAVCHLTAGKVKSPVAVLTNLLYKGHAHRFQLIGQRLLGMHQQVLSTDSGIIHAPDSSWGEMVYQRQGNLVQHI